MTTKRELQKQNDELAELAGDMYMENFALTMQLALAKAGLKMALPYVEKAEVARAKAEAIAQGRKSSELATWPLTRQMTMSANGLRMVVTPSRYDRETTIVIKHDYDGEEAEQVKTTRGKATVRLEMPLFGVQEVVGDVVHVETGQVGETDVQIENKLTFKLAINGEDKLVTITSEGAIFESWFGIMSGYNPAEANVQSEWCNWCEEYHHSEKFETTVTIR